MNWKPDLSSARKWEPHAVPNFVFVFSSRIFIILARIAILRDDQFSMKMYPISCLIIPLTSKMENLATPYLRIM